MHCIETSIMWSKILVLQIFSTLIRSYIPKFVEQMILYESFFIIVMRILWLNIFIMCFHNNWTHWHYKLTCIHVDKYFYELWIINYINGKAVPRAFVLLKIPAYYKRITTSRLDNATLKKIEMWVRISNNIELEIVTKSFSPMSCKKRKKWVGYVTSLKVYDDVLTNACWSWMQCNRMSLLRRRQHLLENQKPR